MAGVDGCSCADEVTVTQADIFFQRAVNRSTTKVLRVDDPRTRWSMDRIVA